MEATHFTSPLEVVQMISMFSYLNTLSDFLLARNYLKEENQHQAIPVVNALYDYLLDDYHVKENESIGIEFLSDTKEHQVAPKDNNKDYYTVHKNLNSVIETKKRNLARKLIRDTDLYGAKENETLDITFVDALYKHIITTLVFEKYTNIYGFLVEIVRTSKNLKIPSLYESILSKLSEEKFLNENGWEAKLESLSISKIIQDFIGPLFPNPQRELNLLSIDYIYAQAGSIFYHSAQNSSLIQLTDYKNVTDDQFEDYITAALAIEQSVIAGKVNETALDIFTLPALLYYAKEKNGTRNIVNNSTLLVEAYKMLFSHLNDSFYKIEIAKENDYKYQFHLALSNFKNRTTLAREMILKKCPLIEKGDLDDEILKYKNNPDTYQCNTGMKLETLEDVNHLFEEQVQRVGDKFFRYEKESIRDAFGADAIKSMDASKIVISKGYITDSFFGGGGRVQSRIDLLRESDDLFQFYYPDNDTNVYYAVIREDNGLSLIKEDSSVPASLGCMSSSDAKRSTKSPSDTKTESAPTDSIIHCTPASFRRKLTLDRDQEFRNRYFSYIKQKHESFDVFLTKIAEERASKFKKSLSTEGYDQTRKEWWKEFGLSLIPFYNCITGIQTKNYDQSAVSCPVDAILTLSLVGEMGTIFEQLTTSFTRSLISSAGTTLKCLGVRMTLRETLAKVGGVFLKEATHLSSLITTETFKSLSIAFLRFLDPGFELIYTIGKAGLRSIGNLIKALEKYPISFVSLEKTLLKSETTIDNSFKKVDSLFEYNVYINKLSQNGYGYGYKFVETEFGQFQVRKVLEYDEQVPVVFMQDPVSNERICKAVNLQTGDIKKRVLHLQYEDFEKTVPTEIRLKSFHDTETCSSRRKRSPQKFLCLRNALKIRRQAVEKSALDFIRETKELSEDIVRTQLRKYIFPGNGEIHLNFVREWRDLIKNGKTDLPAWSKKYELYDPELFDRLRYAEAMDKWSIPHGEAVARMNAIYPPNPRTQASVMNAPFATKFFKIDKAYESVTFEDYSALHNYMTNGYKRIGSYSVEANCMKQALYRLAIRQSDDPIEEYAMTLYRGETRSDEVAQELFFSGRKEIELHRFTSASASRNVARNFLRQQRGDIAIIYEIKFSEPYFRAKVQNIVKGIQEEESVLLPGSKFRIDSASFNPLYGMNTLEVKMTFMHDLMSKHEWYKKIMDELEKLEKDRARLYNIDRF